MPVPQVTMLQAVNHNGYPIASPEVERLCLRIMAMYGLKSPSQMIEYMRSPAGIESINMVIEQIMNEESIQEQLALEQQDKQIRRNRALGFLLLALMSKKEKIGKKLFEQALDERNQIVENTAKEAVYEGEQFLSMIEEMNNYAQTELQNYLAQLNIEAEVIEKEQKVILKETEIHEQKYKIIDKHINKGIELIKSRTLGTTPEISIKRIKGEIFKLDNKIEALSDEIAKMAEEGKDTTEKLAKLNGYALRRETLEAFLKKDSYTLDGELIKHEDKHARYHEVAFQLKPELKLVKHDGQLMVLRKDQNPNNLSPEKLALAKKEFKKNQDQYCEISKLCASNKEAERGLLSTRAEKLSQRSKRLSNRFMIVTHQLSILEDQINQVNQLKQKQQSKTTIQKTTIPTPKPSNTAQITESYRHMLKLMVNQKVTDPTQLMSITQQLSKLHNTDKQVRTLLLNRLEKSGLVQHTNKDSLHRQLLSGSQIQTQTVRELQERINQQFGHLNVVQDTTSKTLGGRLNPFPIEPKPK